MKNVVALCLLLLVVIVMICGTDAIDKKIERYNKITNVRMDSCIVVANENIKKWKTVDSLLFVDQYILQIKVNRIENRLK